MGGVRFPWKMIIYQDAKKFSYLNFINIFVINFYFEVYIRFIAMFVLENHEVSFINVQG